MATFYIEQFGCRATQADAAAIERQLRERGAAPAPGSAAADVVVVNTCTVTAAADAQVREAIRAIHRRNPTARILVTGCYAQRAPEELAALPGVDWVVGNSHKPEIPRLFGELAAQRSTSPQSSAWVPLTVFDAQPLAPTRSGSHVEMSLARAPAKILTGNIFEQADIFSAPVFGANSGLDSIAAGHTRPILKIQDGCNNRCSYCVIPFVRGRSRSLAPNEVLREIRALVAAGAREIVLSGINLGAWGRDLTPRVEFVDLLKRILDETSIQRLRVSSIEPMDVTCELVDLFAANNRVAQHFHIPLQSGSDRILAAMHRWYRAEHYARRVELIGELLPYAAIGADVIAGFPGETEQDHAATLDFIARLPFTYLHVFSFSERPGTAAANLSSQVAPAIVRRRAHELRALAAKKSAEFLNAQVGKKMRVLTLHTAAEIAAKTTDALSSHYLRVRVDGSFPPNAWLDVRVTGREENRLLADPVSEESLAAYASKMTCASAC